MGQGAEHFARRRAIVGTIGALQIPAWGSSFFLLTVLATPIVSDTGWSLTWTVGALSLGLLVSGLASPQVGRLIEQHGGRPVLSASAVLFGAGLLLLAVAPHIAVFYAGWIVIGLAMAAGLYDAAFSTLGRLYGESARQPIAAVTLFGGLASSLSWPLTAYLNEAVGWRGTCLIYAAVHLAIALPLYRFVLPREAAREAVAHATNGAQATKGETLIFAALAATFSSTVLIASTNAIHLLTFLKHHGVSAAAAVALAALVGPAQVAARALEMAIGRYHHAIWTLAASAVLVAAGIVLLWRGQEPLIAALVLYGAGIGITSIARGTVPLALFGPSGYAARIGRIAQPVFIASAAAPTLGALALDAWGTPATLAILTAIAAINVAIVTALVVATQRTR